MDNVLSPRAIAAALTELWSPRVIAEVDEHYVSMAQICHRGVGAPGGIAFGGLILTAGYSDVAMS